MKYLRLLCLFLLLVACKKKVEVIKEVPVEKKNSWSEIKEFTGTQKYFSVPGAVKTQSIFSSHFSLQNLEALVSMASPLGEQVYQRTLIFAFQSLRGFLQLLIP